MLKQNIVQTALTQDQLAFFYLGQEGFLIKYKNTYLLIDPYLSDYVDRNCSTSSLRWKRNYEPPILPTQLDFVDFVFCTHDHYDHMDPDTLASIFKANHSTKFVIPKAVFTKLLSYGIPEENIILASANSILSFSDFRVMPLASAHETLAINQLGESLYLGYKFYFGSTVVYHAGDCCIYEGLEESLQNTDILMLPINGRDYYKLENDIIGNMNILEALTLAGRISADMIIPMHYDLYDVNCVNPAYFVDLIYNKFSGLKFHMFIPGEKFIYSPSVI